MFPVGHSVRKQRRRAEMQVRRSIGDPVLRFGHEEAPRLAEAPGLEDVQGPAGLGRFRHAAQRSTRADGSNKEAPATAGNSAAHFSRTGCERPEKPRCEMIDRSLCKSARVFTPNCAAVVGAPGVGGPDRARLTESRSDRGGQLWGQLPSRASQNARKQALLARNSAH
jgi:hypothetical protein